MKSSEIAKLAGVSVRTLRHYHAIDLLPEPPRGENGYRDYGAGDLVRLLRIKRLSSLGFSLSRISEVLDEMDAHLAEAAGPNADEALDELDRELALQIERLQEQRRTIALLKREQLDPDLPVRFARAAKALIGNAYDTLPVRSGDRDALLIAGHLYTEEDIVELERTVSALGEKGLIEDLHNIQTMFDELPPDATDADIDRVIDAAMEMLDPVIDCFDPANWDSELTPQAELYIDELIRAGLNEAQARAQTQLEETLEARILAKRGAASISSSQDA